MQKIQDYEADRAQGDFAEIFSINISSTPEYVCKIECL